MKNYFTCAVHCYVDKCDLPFTGMQYPLASGSSPNILEHGEPKNSGEEAENDTKKVQHHGPRAMSRSAMVKAVVASSSAAATSNDKLTGDDLGTSEKPVKNVCLVDKPQIFPAPASMTTRAVIEVSSSSSSAEYPTPNHPKGINRMTCRFCFLLGSTLITFQNCCC